MQNGVQKARPVQSGDSITLYHRSVFNKKMQLLHVDPFTIKEIPCVIEDVVWGNIHRTHMDTQRYETIPNMNVGLVCAKVLDTFHRSLVIDSQKRIDKYRNPRAA